MPMRNAIDVAARRRSAPITKAIAWMFLRCESPARLRSHVSVTRRSAPIIAARQQSAGAILREHWRGFGRDYFTRHDFEGLDSAAAGTLMDELRSALSSLPGRDFAAGKVEKADEFSYVDPVDGSRSEGQGVRIFFTGGGRLVFRLSGTGTSGATLRLYCESYQRDPTMLEMDTQRALKPLLQAAEAIAGISRHTGRSAPDVIT